MSRHEFLVKDSIGTLKSWGRSKAHRGTLAKQTGEGIKSMSTNTNLDRAMQRLLDAQDGIPSQDEVNPEALWLQIKYCLAPVADSLVPDFHRYASGSWVLAVYLADGTGYGSDWHPNNDAWHHFWQAQRKSLIAEFYLPYRSPLLLAIPGTKPLPSTAEIPESDAVRLLERADFILRQGQGAPVGAMPKGSGRK